MCLLGKKRMFLILMNRKGCRGFHISQALWGEALLSFWEGTDSRFSLVKWRKPNLHNNYRNFVRSKYTICVIEALNVNEWFFNCICVSLHNYVKSGSMWSLMFRYSMWFNSSFKEFTQRMLTRNQLSIQTCQRDCYSSSTITQRQQWLCAWLLQKL